jgi:hypothetical protein
MLRKGEMLAFNMKTCSSGMESLEESATKNFDFIETQI